jgi:hypothetical protein
MENFLVTGSRSSGSLVGSVLSSYCCIKQCRNDLYLAYGDVSHATKAGLGELEKGDRNRLILLNASFD